MSCDDRPGLVATVASFLAGHGGNITDAAQHGEGERFFMRLAFDLPPDADRDDFAAAVRAMARAQQLEARLRWSDSRPKLAILVSKQDHCLRDLLYRSDVGELPGEVAVVISNHRDAAEAVERRGLPFVHLPVTPETKAEQEAKLLATVEASAAEVIVLARYMQVLSPSLSKAWSGRCINIHHGLLPAFKGGRPYHQAYDRGVKLVGATSHYVTEDLDAGPIIAQDVEVVSHRDTVDDLIRKGRDLERSVLAAAVRAHLEDRILVQGGRAVVFD